MPNQDRHPLLKKLTHLSLSKKAEGPGGTNGRDTEGFIRGIPQGNSPSISTKSFQFGAKSQIVPRFFKNVECFRTLNFRNSFVKSPSVFIGMWIVLETCHLSLYTEDKIRQIEEDV
jgi:hypothetical protein